MVSPRVFATAAPYTEQAMVGDWPARLFWIGVLVVCVAATLWLVRRGWVKRARRFDGQPALDRTVVAGDVLARGRYLGSAVAGNWLDRITAEGLGAPSSCDVVLGEHTLSFMRPGDDSFTVPRNDIVAVRTDRGLLGEVYGADGVIVVSWQWGGLVVDSGFRADPVTAHVDVLAGLSEYRVNPSSPASSASTQGDHP